MKNAILLGLILSLVICLTPVNAQIQWAGTHVIDLDAETLSLGAFTTWPNAGSAGGSFNVFTTAGGTAPSVVQYNRGESAVDTKAVLMVNPTWQANPCESLGWSNTAGSLFGGVTSSFSVEAWIYDEAYREYEAFMSFAKRDGGVNWVGFWTGGWANGSPESRFLYGEPIGTILLSREMRQSPPTAGVFNHYVFTYDTATGASKAYINGNLAASATLAPGFVPVSAEPVALGAYARGAGATMGLDGAIAKVRVHIGVLTPAQITNNFEFEAGDYVTFSAPVFVDETVDLPGYSGRSFSYTAPLAASALPSPTWSLTDEPAGMVIDATTGEITWSSVTGAVDDTHVFTVHAENIRGSDDLDVTLTVIPAPADAVVLNDSAQLNLTDRDVLAAVNFYDPTPGDRNHPTVGSIQGVDFDDFNCTTDDTGSPIALLAGAPGATLSTVFESGFGREFGSDPTLLGFSGPDATEAEKLAFGGVNFESLQTSTLTFAFGGSYADTDVEIQMLGGGVWARTDRQGKLVMSVDSVEKGELYDRGTPDLITFSATTDGSGDLVIEVVNTRVNPLDVGDRQYTMLTGTIVTVAGGPPPPTATPRPPSTAVEDWEIYN